MKLHHQISGQGQPLLIIHGLFGSSDNWRMLVKQLSEHAQVISVDLRNHGRSPHSDEQAYRQMADDIAELLIDLGIDSIDIIGHSIGGKVAMALSQYYSNYCKRLVVVDMAPRQYQQAHTMIFDALLSLDLGLYSKRSEVDAELAKTISDKAVRQFLLMNLTTEATGLKWRINLVGLSANYVNLLAPVCEGERINTPSCFIRGGRSDYILDSDKALISSTFINAEIHTIEKAGHWVHAEQAEAFLNHVKTFLSYPANAEG